MTNLIRIGTRIRHGFGLSGHGFGTIVAYNGVPENKYLQEKPLEAIEMAAKVGLTDAIVSSVYNGQEYPYTIKFDNGYQDHYSGDNFNIARPSSFRNFVFQSGAFRFDNGSIDVSAGELMDHRGVLIPARQFREDGSPLPLVAIATGPVVVRYRVVKGNSPERTWRDKLDLETDHRFYLPNHDGLGMQEILARSEPPGRAMTRGEGSLHFDANDEMYSKAQIRCREILLSRLAEKFKGEPPFGLWYEFVIGVETMTMAQYLTERGTAQKVDLKGMRTREEMVELFPSFANRFKARMEKACHQEQFN